MEEQHVYERVLEIYNALTKPSGKCTGPLCSISNCTCDEDRAVNLLSRWLKEMGDCPCYSCRSRGQGACDGRV